MFKREVIFLQHPFVHLLKSTFPGCAKFGLIQPKVIFLGDKTKFDLLKKEAKFFLVFLITEKVSLFKFFLRLLFLIKIFDIFLKEK